MKKVLQRIIAIVCMMALTVAVLPAAGLRADDEPGKPKISVKAVNGTDVEVTIGKTKGTDGYEVWITSDCGYTGYKNTNRSWRYYDYIDNPGDYINAVTVEKDGSAVRTVTIKNLSKARVSVKVRAYIGNHYNTRSYSDFSKAKTVKVTAQKKGYKTSYDFSKVKKGDTIKFGTYEQDYPVDGKDPIEWVVLDKTKNSIVVMSKYALDCLPYNIELTDFTWETCTLRKWLNEKFYNAAFNKTEKVMIRETTLSNNYNFGKVTSGCDDTKDKVFLLSYEDVKKESYDFDRYSDVFDTSRRCAPSRYAVAQGAYQYAGTNDEDCITADNEGAGWWWLRSSGWVGPVKDSVMAVYPSGSIFFDFSGINLDVAVRPALVLDLKS